MKKTALERIEKLGLLAVLRGPSVELTLDMVNALVAGGVTGIEITYTTPNAPEVLRRLDARFGDEILLGMGTLSRPEQADEARLAGARFLVSPMYDPELASAMVASQLPVMIGALTPREVFQAFNAGSDVVKVFPGSLTGPGYLKALHGPFPHIPMMPTGGVNLDNIGDWFASGAFAVGAGSNLCPGHLAKAGKFDEISAIAKQFVHAVKRAKGQ
jgi:2-dehydro-3-deoxyphosphogluconate aldolase/(4S)-4-hydroxy-2-oxoglutarate aldolase